jgi:hypothetical protein
MSRITAPVAKQLARSLNAASVSGAGAARPGAAAASGLLDHNAGAVLMPKYAELLRNREASSDVSFSFFFFLYFTLPSRQPARLPWAEPHWDEATRFGPPRPSG